jgi:hypothetical protein
MARLSLTSCAKFGKLHCARSTEVLPPPRRNARRQLSTVSATLRDTHAISPSHRLSGESYFRSCGRDAVDGEPPTPAVSNALARPQVRHRRETRSARAGFRTSQCQRARSNGLESAPACRAGVSETCGNTKNRRCPRRPNALRPPGVPKSGNKMRNGRPAAPFIAEGGACRL